MSLSFEPIAIIGRACLLPGASTPEELWELVRSGKDVLSPAPSDRWGMPDGQALASGDSCADRSWTDRGGYVQGFEERFDPKGFGLDEHEVLGLDPLFQWLLHTGREALQDAGIDALDGRRVGAVFGNLSFPSAAMARYAESVWAQGHAEGHAPENRFHSGLPAILLERALGLDAGAFALDAACASSLYAIKNACDWLRDGRADVMLAGAVNCADDLFIHVGFSALSALSKTGRSQPFSRDADGLVPAEGSAFVALRRLEDARRDGDRVLGVIRGVGLSNDGRGQGVLVPSREGQVRAMQAAYTMSGLRPQDISLLECHATGTTLGDATEIESLTEVYGAIPEPLGIGSLKSNMGHLITTAGVAGLIKVLEAMKEGQRPPTLHAESPIEALEGSSFRVLAEPEPWAVPDHVSDGVRRAGVSAFGFGGNNAHLIVEEAEPHSEPATGAAAAPIRPTDPVAIVGIGVVAAGSPDRAAFTEALFGGESQLTRLEDGSMAGQVDAFELELAALGIPPNDLRQTLPQQLLVLDAGRQAAAEVGPLPRERTGVYVGMGTDPEVSRYGARWRLANDHLAGSQELEAARKGVVAPLEAAGVVGTMPNIVANRLNRLLDLGGPSCSVSLEERSGLAALDLAVRALAANELDAALVGAVDLSCEPVHQRALSEVRRRNEQNQSIPGDAAVVLVLKRLSDAVGASDRIYAVVEPTRSEAHADEVLPLGPDSEVGDLEPRFGHAHAASGLLHLASAALATHHRTLPNGRPWLSHELRRSQIVVHAMQDGPSGPARWQITEHAESVRTGEFGARPAPIFAVYEGHDATSVLQALDADRRSEPSKLDPPKARLVLVAPDEETRLKRAQRAHAHIQSGAPAGPGVHYRGEPVEGELAFVFTSAGSAYRGMGRELLAELPELGDQLGRRFEGLADAFSWVFDDSLDAPPPTNEERLWGASCVSQIHAELSRGLLGLRPDAAIGYSSGESGSLFAMGAWTDMDAMRREIEESGLYATELAGRFDAVARAWKQVDTPVGWSVYGVLASVPQLQAWIEKEERVHLAIVHTPTDAVIAGDEAGCARIVAQVEQTFGTGRCHRLEYNMAAHVPEVDAFREAWLDIHRRKVSPVPGVRFYSGGSDQAYEPETEACTQTIFRQAHQTLDFGKVIEQAWADGIRTFVEHGPMSACAGWIREILGDRAQEAAIVSLDRKDQGIEALWDAVAALVAAGVPLDPTRLIERLSPSASHDHAADTDSQAPKIRLPAHAPPVRIEPSSITNDTAKPLTPSTPDRRGALTMKPAPTLPSVANEAWVAHPSSTAPAAAALQAASPAAAEPQVSQPLASVDEETAAWNLHVQHLSAMHQQFVAQQAVVHERFLAVRKNLQHTLEASGAEASALPHQALLADSLTQTTHPAPEQPIVQPTVPPATQPVITPAQPQGILQKPIGLTLDRAQLEIHASGRISEIYGPLFEQQDGFERQVRMPEPPLLLADRVTGIDAKPGEHGTGIMWTETDVTEESWYLNRGRMPAGIMIESGQADLMLISYMGADFLNQGERVYRLLGCELTYLGDLPRAGETLSYEIHVDGHARQDEVRLFFFHYDSVVDGQPRIQVRGGQAGFFNDEELANSEGILWSPEEFEPVAEPRLDPPAVDCQRSRFDGEQIRSFSEGRAWECFGEGFEHSQTHTQSPAIQSGKMLFLDEVTEFDPVGGPWGRGYLRAESAVQPDDWFFDGHFKNDPCMPGTLMFEGCVQAMSFYLAALGFTLERDAWRFQPVVGEPIDLRCRGQVTPTSRELVYEIFVEEVHDGPVPTLYADLLCTVDGRKAFHARRAGLQLVPDWPLSSRPDLVAACAEDRTVAAVPTPDGGHFAFDAKSILACAWGRPSEAFGPMYERFDGPGRVPRLPGPPYLFMSRVTKTSGEIGEMEVGSTVEVEYDIPEDAWYFDENGARTMPYAVLLEAALQPCGWLASYIGSALTVDEEVCFRNLDGTATLEAELFEDAGTLRTAVKLTNISQSAGMIIVSFDVECFLSGAAGEHRVYVMDTVFGFFPPETLSLENQIGQPTSEEQHSQRTEPGNCDIDLRDEPDTYFGGSLRLANTRLRTLDRVTGYWPEGGPDGLGRVRAERSIDAGDWYFKAHFFQDPVQPGSLGIEAMIQTLQFFMIESGMGEGLDAPRFEPIALDRPMGWKYRGQVVPLNETVQVTLDITEIGTDEHGPFAIANASLWCDGIRIYSADGMGMRIVSGGTPLPSRRLENEQVLDPKVDTWLADHCPTWNRPALPMMCVADKLASAVPGPVSAIRDVQLKGWLDFDGPRRFWTVAEARREGDFLVRLFSAPVGTDDGVEVATGRVLTGPYKEAPPAFPSEHGATVPDPYFWGDLFHGPAFQLLKSASRTDHGASCILDASGGTVPTGLLHPALLDAGLHAIPHDRLHEWSSEVGEDKVAYPARVLELNLYDSVPTQGEVRCEVRFDGFLAAPDLPRFCIQWIGAHGVFAQLTLVEACFPKGPLGSAAPLDRRAFLRDHQFVEGLSLAKHGNRETWLTAADVAASDWMPGTIQGIYGTEDIVELAVKEHLAERERLHPSVLPEAIPLHSSAVQIHQDGADVVVQDELGFDPENRELDLRPLHDYWNRLLGTPSGWLGEDLWEGIFQRYLGRFVVEDPQALADLHDRGAIFVGNHQVQIESLLITNLLSALIGKPVVTMANAKHEQGWIGDLLRSLFSYPGSQDPQSILYFDPAKPASMAKLLEGLKPDLASGRRDFFVHPEGTRSQSCLDPVTKISSLFLDLALELDLPIIPVRFSGGLPLQPIVGKLEFPISHCAQDYAIGRPILPEELRALAYGDRGRRVTSAMNNLGPAHKQETPNRADPNFAAQVQSWQEQARVSEVQATFFRILEEVQNPRAETLALLGPDQAQEHDGSPEAVWLADFARRLYGAQLREKTSRTA